MSATEAVTWPDEIFDVFKRHDIRQVAYLPDAGHTRLINRCADDNDIRTTGLTTEEEGIPLLAGAWLGGEKGVMLMQSSGVGNTINMLSLIESCRIPFVTIVTMRGEYGEFNPWQVPMGRATPDVLSAMGLNIYRADEPEEAAATVEAALRIAFDGNLGAAVLLSQRLIGRKPFTVGAK